MDKLVLELELDVDIKLFYDLWTLQDLWSPINCTLPAKMNWDKRILVTHSVYVVVVQSSIDFIQDKERSRLIAKQKTDNVSVCRFSFVARRPRFQVGQASPSSYLGNVSNRGPQLWQRIPEEISDVESLVL